MFFFEFLYENIFVQWCFKLEVLKLWEELNMNSKIVVEFYDLGFIVEFVYKVFFL